MTEQFAIDTAQNAFVIALQIGGPLLGASLVVGMMVSVFQAVTQINEQTLTFVPKIIAVFVAMLVAGPWLMSSLVSYTSNLFSMLPAMVR